MHDLRRRIRGGGPHRQQGTLPEICRGSGGYLQRALRLVECWGDDIPDGEITSFPMAVQCKPDETVVFSWILWPSKAIRDQGMEKVMSDPRLPQDENAMPFDGKRMIYGGFEMLVDA